MDRRQFLKTTAAVGLTLMGVDCNPSSPSQDAPAKNELEEIILSYLSQPKWTSTDFAEQVTGTKAKLEMLHIDEQQAYFSIAASDFEKGITLQKLTHHPEKVEFGALENNRLHLGDYTFGKPGSLFFRFPADHFKVDPQRIVQIDYAPFAYTLTMKELAAYGSDRSIYGGKSTALLSIQNGVRNIMTNYGFYIAKKDEPSLVRLVKQITASASTPEDQAQALLDFVTGRIQYDSTPQKLGIEIEQRPNEVLMAREGDCSGKALLYASLLEQTGIDYRMFYLDSHLCTVVAGAFPSDNGLSFRYDGKKYTLAESACTDRFVIGETQLVKPFTAHDILYVQKPGPDAPISDAKTGKALQLE